MIKKSIILSSEEDSDHMKTTIRNLAESSTQGICIDYAIDSYEIVRQFGYELFAQISNSENPVLSPVSAYLALSMAGCGAGGTTWEEFHKMFEDMEVYSDRILMSYTLTSHFCI